MLHGDAKPARWPEGDLDQLERERREEIYRLTVLLDREDEEEEPFREGSTISKQDFESYAVGDPVTFWVSPLGSVQRWEVGDHTAEEETP